MSSTQQYFTSPSPQVAACIELLSDGELFAEIKVFNGKAIFVFEVSPELARVKQLVDNPETMVRLQDVLQAQSALKKRMYGCLLAAQQGGN